MSSIVKARVLGEFTRNPEYYKARVEVVREESTWEAVLETTTDTLFDTAQNHTEEIKEGRHNLVDQAVMWAQQIENEARIRADSLKENATKESREIFQNAGKEGYDKGFNEGYLEGQRAAQEAAAEGLEEVKSLVQLMTKERLAALERQRQEMVNIAFELAKKIMKQQVQTDETFLVKMLEDIIQENDETSLKVYLSEYHQGVDLKVDKTMSKKLRSTFKEAKVILIKENDKIMVETPDGVVDMSMPVQLEQLKTAISEMDS